MSRNKNLLTLQMSSQRRALLFLAAGSLGLGAAIAGQAALLAEAVQRIFVERASFSSMAGIFGALLAVMAVRSLLFYENGSIGLKISAASKTTFRAGILRRVAAAPISEALQGQTGGKVSVALDAVDETDAYFSQYVPRMIEACIIPLVLLSVVFTQHLNSGLIMVVTAPFIPLFMILVGIQTKRKSEEKYTQLAEFSGTFLDSLQGLISLKLFGRTQHQQQEIERSSLSYRDATMGILKIAFTNTFMLEMIVMMSIGIVALELALQLLVYKTLSFHTALVVLLLAPEFYSLLKNTGIAFHSGRTSMGAARKVEELLSDGSGQNAKAVSVDGPEENVQIRGPHKRGNARGAAGARASHQGIVIQKERAISSNGEAPSIELKDVSFQYVPNGFQLQKMTLKLNSGENTAIAGASGSGKTTLLHLFAGLLTPSSGQVLVNGSPLEQLEEAEWFRRISYITQHPYIFTGTIADNIAIGANRPVTRKEVIRAAETAGLADVAAALSQGYDTIVGEGGRGLSGGEKQRLALARAFLKKPSVLLFDEPTAGLDLLTERVLQKSIAELAQTATVITVAHRLYTIRKADRVLFLDQGKLQAAGRHEELLACAPLYAGMVGAQQKGGLL